MCGIAGIAYLNSDRMVDPSLLDRMTDRLAHRGPDGRGRWVETVGPSAGKVGLGHRRLAIIDLTDAAAQPMSNDDGSLWLTFNGEIYNYVELRRQLADEGVRFKTQSDTEVLLKLYERMGAACLGRLRGMFAFGVWDRRRHVLFLARDRVGKKPLYYSPRPGGLAFASEIKAILEDPDQPRRVELKAINHFLAYGYSPSPETAFEGILKLPPGHYLELDRLGVVRITRYWKLSFEPKEQVDWRTAQEEFRRVVSEAIKIRLRSDVPLGAFLSGGLDSGTVVALASRMVDKPLKTFTIGFDESDYDEMKYARLVAQALGTEHREWVVRPDALRLLPSLVWHYNEPFSDSSALPTYCVAAMTRTEVTVALNGDGGDETLAGYRRYWAMGLWRFLRRIPSPLLRQGWRLARALRRGAPLSARGWGRDADHFMEAICRYPDAAGLYARWVSCFDLPRRQALWKAPLAERAQAAHADVFLKFLLSTSDARNPVEQAMDVDVQSYLPEDLLVKMDVATMAHGLEARSPLLDHVYMEWAARLPRSYKLAGGTTKRLLRAAMRNLLPARTLRRGKMGFGVPVGVWFRGPLRRPLEEALLSPDSAVAKYFNQDLITQWLGEHQKSVEDHSHRLWALWHFERWHRMWIDRRDPEPETVDWKQIAQEHHAVA